MRRLLFLAPVLAFVLVMAGFALGLRRDPSLLPSVLIGKPLPAFALAPVRPGDQGFTNADLGGEPALVNVYGSWCATCRIEHPMLMRLRAQGVPVYGIDWMDTAEKGNGWLQQFGDPYIRVGNDESGRAGIDLGVSGAPETFVVDKQGRVRYRHVGEITEDDWTRKIGPLMEKLKAES